MPQRHLGSAQIRMTLSRDLKKIATTGLLIRSRPVELSWAKCHKKARGKRRLRYRNFIWISSHGIRSTEQRCARVRNFWRMPQIQRSNMEVGRFRRPETLGVRLVARRGRDRRRHVIQLLDMVGGVAPPD